MDLEKIPYQFIYIDLTVKNLQRDLQIVQKGPHKELVQKEGLYQRLWEGTVI